MTRPEELRCWRRYERYRRGSGLWRSRRAPWNQTRYGTEGWLRPGWQGRASAWTLVGEGPQHDVDVGRQLTASAAPVDGGRVARVDVLRGVAILMVVAFHTYGAAFGSDRINFNDLRTGATPFPGWSFLLLYPLHFGSAGVALFFVISGYVIHRSYLRDRRFGWAVYASRRFWRIYPAYACALVGFSAWMGSVWSRNVALHATFTHNFFADTFFGINPVFWSLAVEVQLYLLYPLAIVIQRRWGATAMLTAGLIASLFWHLGAAVLIEWPGPRTYHLWLSPIALWPDWLLGAYLAECHVSGRRAFVNPWLWAGCGFAVLLSGEYFKPLGAIQFSAASLVSAVVLDRYVYDERLLGRSGRVLAAVGVCSYSLYLIHQPFLWHYVQMLAQFGVWHPAAQSVLGFPSFALVVTCVAWAMYATVERGGIKVGSWFARALGLMPRAQPSA